MNRGRVSIRARPGGLCDPDDIAQETRIARWEAQQRWNPDLGALPPFEATIVRRRHVDLIRRSTRTPVWDTLDGAAALGCADATWDPACIVCDRDTTLRLAAEVPFTAMERHVFLFLFAGYAQADIAVALNLTAKQVDNAATRVRHKCRAAWPFAAA